MNNMSPISYLKRVLHMVSQNSNQNRSHSHLPNHYGIWGTKRTKHQNNLPKSMAIAHIHNHNLWVLKQEYHLQTQVKTKLKKQLTKPCHKAHISLAQNGQSLLCTETNLNHKTRVKKNAKINGKQSRNVTSRSMSNHTLTMSTHMANHLPKHCQNVS